MRVTKIAFQNDKIDLLKAESIGDLIHAETELQRDQAVKLVQGNASNYYNDLREKLIKILLRFIFSCFSNHLRNCLRIYH